MTPKDREAFIVATFELSKASYSMWTQFMRAFEAHVVLQCEDAVKAPVAEAPTAHGRAQTYLALRDSFRNIEMEFAKLRGPAP